MTRKAKLIKLRPRSLLLLIFFLSYLVVIISACASETPALTPTPPAATSQTPSPTVPPSPSALPTSDTAAEGRSIFIGRACVGCHTIQGIPEAQGKVGPELTHQASNSLIADTLSNTEENLKKFIKNPAKVKPGALMPNQYLTDSDIEALVAFLRTLK